MENESLETSGDRVAICGSPEWLRRHAWFVCDHCMECEHRDSACLRADELKMLDGMTICDQCWSDHPGEVPEVWTDLDKFDPFACLSA
jgi:transcription elongation factor Elf1